MRLGVGALVYGGAMRIRDKHKVSMATSERQPPPSRWSQRSVEIKNKGRTYLTGRNGERRSARGS